MMSGRSTVVSSMSISRAKASLVVASIVYKYYSESHRPDFHTKSTGRVESGPSRDYIGSFPIVLGKNSFHHLLRQGLIKLLISIFESRDFS